jgi:hypothetical protein
MPDTHPEQLNTAGFGLITILRLEYFVYLAAQVSPHLRGQQLVAMGADVIHDHRSTILFAR